MDWIVDKLFNFICFICWYQCVTLDVKYCWGVSAVIPRVYSLCGFKSNDDLGIGSVVEHFHYNLSVCTIKIILDFAGAEVVSL